ncbi:MAG: hypothetical protein M3O46_05980 [Myxococcota bacterium]|nr:hypothetical protein [Myxococcota bacterium]
MTLRTAALLMVVFLGGGCRGCQDHPYVPYVISSSQPTIAPPASSLPAIAGPAPTASGPTAFLGDPAILAPPGLARWPMDDIVLESPEGRTFVSALVRDFDGDGAKDAFAIVRAAEGDIGEVVFYRGRRDGEALLAATTFTPPAGLSQKASCVAVARLTAIGARSVLVELGAPCPLQASSAPDRWIAVITVGTDARVRLAATISDPPGAATLSVDGDTEDLDRDGLEDVSLRVTLEGGGAPLEPGPRVGVIFAWLDRTAGLSREAAATDSSFAALAAAAKTRAGRAKEAPSVHGFVEQVRALWRAACADGGAPRMVGVAGTGAITCGATRALGDLGLAEVRAYVTTGDSLRAALALDRADRPPASPTGERVSETRRRILQLAPVSLARGLRAVAAVPGVASGHEPTWGPLAFEASGKLLVRTRAGVVRVDPDTGDETTAEGVVDWKPAVTSPDGAMRWIEAYDPCDGLPLHATFTPVTGDDLRDVALPIAAPLGGHCVGSRGAPARTLPIAWGPGGIEAIVEGEPVLISSDLTHATLLASFLGQPVTAGAPRSPDGRTLVVPTGSGLLVATGARARLFRAPEIDHTYGDQRDCTVSNDAARVGCVRAGKAWVGTWDGV